MKQLITTNSLLEGLARIEHEQWAHWSLAVAAQMPEATREKWRRAWVDYDELPDEAKELDRIWARKVLALLQEHKLI